MTLKPFIEHYRELPDKEVEFEVQGSTLLIYVGGLLRSEHPIVVRGLVGASKNVLYGGGLDIVNV